MDVAEKPEAIFGQYGLSKVAYQGTAKGRYKGPETCHWYEVAPGKVLYVDNRDKGKFLSLRDAQGRNLFEVA